jgi:putative SOS response-associated peptidase YedK
MCGRTAQTVAAIRAAAETLGFPQPNINVNSKDVDATENSSPTEAWKGDNYNFCPGMSAVVFYKNQEGILVSEPLVWGLITKGGSSKNPLPTGVAQHFSALMYNARSDTLYTKPTFGNLLGKQQSCIVAMDGWFEWKQEVKGRKQPYFVKAKHEPYTLFPGLWTRVATGRSENPFLTTFTILTTDADPCIKWLHTRMPVCCFDPKLAHAWLDTPTQKIHESLLLQQHADGTSIASSDRWDWHAVTDEMTSLKFRSIQAIAPWKRPTLQNFLKCKAETSDETAHPSAGVDITTSTAKWFVIESSVSSSSSTVKKSPSKIKSSINPSSEHNTLQSGHKQEFSIGKRTLDTAFKIQSSASKKLKKDTQAPSKSSITNFFLPKKTM